MGSLRDISIRQKLQGIVMLTCGVAVAAASIMFAVYDRVTFLRAKTEDLATTAKILGSNSTAALTFGDTNSAREILAALRVRKHVVFACIYDKDGKVFAKYSREKANADFAAPPPQADGSSIVNRRILLFRQITLDDEPVGTIYIESDLDELKDRLNRFTTIAVFVLLASLALAFVLSAKLQRVISGPILSLAKTAFEVTANKGYSIRATKSSNDEIGFLFDRFNEMLDGIQQRDAALQKAQEELERRVEERTSYLNSLIETSPLAIVVLDSQRRVQLCNPAFEELFGYARAEIADRPLDDLLVPEELMAEFQEGLRRSEEGAPIHRVTRRRRKDGTLVDVELHGVPLRVAGKVTGLLGIYQNITERLRAEQELQRAKEAAEAASEAKSDFLANMSHEIRTPMNGILGMTELALDTSLNVEQREYLTTVKSSADSLLSIINDILDFSKIEAGKLEFENIEFSLRDSLAETVKTLALRAHQKGLELAYRVSANVHERVIGDPGRLRQIVVNLVGNAIKFTNQGEVVVEVEQDSRQEKSLELHFRVRDTGIGIEPEKQKVIFDAFTQADNSMTRRYGGTGLGLAITKRLVEKMEGKIWIESELGRGSTFHFLLSLGIGQGQSKLQSPLELAQVRGLRVLIVDDNRTNRFILSELLQHWGMKPHETEDAAAALRALTKAAGEGSPFQLVLLDAQMPDVDGFELAKKIRQDPANDGIPLLMLSSSALRGEGTRCREVGIAAYLSKPVAQSELLNAILTTLAVPEPAPREQVVTRHSMRERRSGMRILLAEDNAVNRQLALKLLEKHGHKVVVAENGRQALEALEREKVDLVLMDVQMPEMDGFEATAAIRAKEKTSGGHLPIIAVTAHAMKGDRERCLAAGMDDYIAKPIRTPELAKLLDRYSGMPHSADQERPPDSPRDVSSVFRPEEALDRVEGDRELLAELVKLFEEETPKLLAEVRDAIAKGDAKTLERAAHTIKGSAGNFGAQPASQAALDLEQLARSGDLSRATELMEAVEREIKRLLPELEHFSRGVTT
jgi:two-component system, sensor histidine kinase and response regulator